MRDIGDTASTDFIAYKDRRWTRANENVVKLAEPCSIAGCDAAGLLQENCAAFTITGLGGMTAIRTLSLPTMNVEAPG